MPTTSTPTPSETHLSILRSGDVTATVVTESGSHYTVVARRAVGVVVIHDTRGWVCQGKRLAILNGRMYLYGLEGNILASTTRIASVYIATN
jgi:hypothetical protein